MGLLEKHEIHQYLYNYYKDNYSELEMIIGMNNLQSM